MAIILGIDTGGTYTDGVLIDTKNKKVISHAKSLTTHHDYTIGIHNCIESLVCNRHEEIKCVVLSTTLATNAIIEDKGSPVGLLLIGKEPIGKLPTSNYAVLKGGHNIFGKPMEDLDIKDARDTISNFRGKISAMAISGYSSVRNPEHELEIKKIVEEILDIPVVCGHELTSDLGFHERTVTTVLNAKLIPIISNLIMSTKKALFDNGVKATFMMVKGDGTLMSELVTMQKPIDTISSGPAASAIGGYSLTNSPELIVIDMGGTTTDISILKNGEPRINNEGALIGGWRTRVKAIEVYTYGIGGDSYLQFDKDSNLIIGPERVIPISKITCDHTYLIEEMNQRYEINRIWGAHQVTDCLLVANKQSKIELNDTEKELMHFLESGPHTIGYIIKKFDKDFYKLHLDELINCGMIAKASLTPTDLIHATGGFTPWNVDGAKNAIRHMAEVINFTPEEFIIMALDHLTEKLILAVLESLLHYEGTIADKKDSRKTYHLIDKIVTPKKDEIFSCQIKINYPIVAIGAPVAAYVPKVADKLNARLLIPQYAAVANAIGAATGRIIHKIEVLIKTTIEGEIVLHAPWEMKVFYQFDDAIKYSLEEINNKAISAATKLDIADYNILIDQKDSYINSNCGLENNIHLETKIIATVVGNPKFKSI